jgi:hypothetical protein
MKRTIRIVFFLILMVGFSFGQQKRFQIALFGGVNQVFPYGSADDYAAGVNDFPITPAHMPVNLGASLLLNLSDRLGVELRGEYVLGSGLTLTDPSDQDSVAITSSKRMAVSANLIWTISRKKLELYLALGGGVDKMLAKEGIYTSAKGYKVVFDLPEKAESLFANAGAGLRIPLTVSLGACLDIRYRLIFAKPDMLNNLIAGAGISLKF